MAVHRNLVDLPRATPLKNWCFPSQKPSTSSPRSSSGKGGTLCPPPLSSLRCCLACVCADPVHAVTTTENSHAQLHFCVQQQQQKPTVFLLLPADPGPYNLFTANPRGACLWLCYPLLPESTQQIRWTKPLQVLKFCPLQTIAHTPPSAGNCFSALLPQTPLNKELTATSLKHHRVSIPSGRLGQEQRFPEHINLTLAVNL